MSAASKAAAALAPSLWAEHLARTKLARRQRNAAGRRRRALTRARIEMAEMVLAAIIDGGDVIADELLFEHRYETVRGVALLVTLSRRRFRDLCTIGAEIEDDEDSHDAEEVNEDLDLCDDEPSLGNSVLRDGLVVPDGEACLPLPDMVEGAKARAREAAGFV